MSIPITKHYIVVSDKHIARKLFLCRQCNKPCIPKDFKEMNSKWFIATAYVCDRCNVKFITNEVLRQKTKTMKEKRKEYDLNHTDPYSDTFEYPTEE